MHRCHIKERSKKASRWSNLTESKSRFELSLACSLGLQSFVSLLCESASVPASVSVSVLWVCVCLSVCFYVLRLCLVLCVWYVSLFLPDCV